MNINHRGLAGIRLNSEVAVFWGEETSFQSLNTLYIVRFRCRNHFGRNKTMIFLVFAFWQSQK